MDEKELYELLEETVIEPATPAPPGVEERYQEMIRAHFERASVQLPGWRPLATLTACVSLVLGLILAPRFSLLFALSTVACAGSYVAFLRFAAGRVQAARPA